MATNSTVMDDDNTADVVGVDAFRSSTLIENTMHKKVQDSLLFTMHVPNLLFSLLIDNIVMENDGLGFPVPRFPQIPRPPIIRRFRGALTFLDISGFTALSQKLDVESLKSHINSYFSKMISVVDEYGGDVMKFAGDALYIVWPAGPNTSITTAVNKAVSAALRACELCNQHEIIITKPSGQEITYLNVHAGVTYGTMAVCDVGCDNEDTTNHHGHPHFHSSSLTTEKNYAYSRWETLILGHPLTAVAVCESQATSGEVVCCQGVYNLLRGQEQPNYDCQAYLPPVASEQAPIGHGLSSDITVTATSDGHEEEQEERIGDIVFHRREHGTYRVQYEGVRSSREAALKAPLFTRDTNDDSVHSSANDEGGSDVLVDVLQDNCKVSFLMHIIMRIQHKWPSLPKHSQMELKRYIMSSIKGHVHDAARDSMVVDVTSVRQATEKGDNEKRDMQHLKRGTPVSVVDQAMMVSGELRKVTALFINIKLNVELSFPCNKTTNSSPEIDVVHEQGASGGGVSVAPRLDLNDDNHNTVHRHTTTHQHHQQVVGNIGLDDLIPFLTLTAEEQKADQALLSSLQVPPTPLPSLSVLSLSLLHSNNHTDHCLTVDLPTFGLHTLTTIPPTNPLGRDRHCRQFSFPSQHTLLTPHHPITPPPLLPPIQQDVMDIVGTSLAERGGQMRQFIHDDKGTVCIGTFGLRGSATDDNSASGMPFPFPLPFPLSPSLSP